MFTILQMLKAVPSHSAKAQILPSAAKDRPHCPLSTPYSPPYATWTLGHLLAPVPAGPAAWKTLSLDPHVTGSPPPFRAFLACHPLTPPSVVNPSDTAIPLLFSSYPYLMRYIYVYIKPIYFTHSLLPPLEWNLHKDRTFVSLLAIVFSALNSDWQMVGI